MRRRSTNNTDTMTASEFRRLISGDLPRNSITTPIGNRKVLNATKTEENGVIFDSRLERYMHDLLKSHGIGFLFQKRYTLQEPFTYNGENVRAITYTLDFYLPDYDMAIDTKGVDSAIGYDEKQQMSWARCSLFHGAKLLQNAGAVRMIHDGSAFVAT